MLMRAKCEGKWRREKLRDEMKGESGEKECGSPSVRRAENSDGWTLGLFSLLEQMAAACSSA